MIKGNDFVTMLEKYDRKMGNKSNYPAKAPADIGEALKRSQKDQGYSKMPKIKPQKMKGK